MSELTGSNQRCRAQFKCVQIVVDQRFGGNGPNGLSYYYYCSRLKSVLLKEVGSGKQREREREYNMHNKHNDVRPENRM